MNLNYDARPAFPGFRAQRVLIRAAAFSMRAAAGLLLVCFLAACATAASQQNEHAAAQGFVAVKDGRFMLDGKPFRFVGTNNYYMHYESDKMLSDVLDAAAAMDVRVLRVWGFMNGMTSQNRDHNVYGMTEPPTAESGGSFGVPESKKNAKGAKYAFERLDFTIVEAGKRGIKLVIALNNYWADFGGIQQGSAWQQWFDLEKPTDFYSDPAAREAYKAYVSWMLNRVNSYTGVPYNRDPTIMTWQLMNEPRNPDDKSGKIVTAWAKEMSGWVKKHAPLQLCAVGDEGAFNRKDLQGFMDEGNHLYNGFEGTDFDALLALKDIDYGTYHLYPESWGISAEAVTGWGVKWIKDHVDSGKALKKPVVLEEYGISASGGQNRLAIYDLWNNTVLESDGAGSMYWILTASNDKEFGEPGADGLYDDYDGFRIMNDDSDVSALLRRYAARFEGGERDADKTRVYMLDPAKDREAKDFYRLRFLVIEEGKRLKDGWLHIDGKKSNLLQYNREQNAWRYNLDTNAIEDGTILVVKGVFTFDDGSVLETPERKITISNRVSYSELIAYDFAESTYGASSLGAYQASLKTISHSKLNGGMLAVDADFPGINEWEELKVKMVPLEGVSASAKIRFTLYFRKDLAVPSSTKSKPENSLPGTQPYAAFDPGWVKTGLHESNQYLRDLEILKLDDGKEYYRQIVEIEYFNNPQFTGVTLCPTLGFVAYPGTVYIDDLILYKKD